LKKQSLRSLLKYKFTDEDLGEIKMVIDRYSRTTSFKQRVKKIAEREWEFFDRGNKKEDEEGAWQRVGDYWRDGVGINDRDGRDRQYRWSAAFVSWVMKNAGAGNHFNYSSRHSVYIRDAIQKRKNNDNSTAFKGYRLNEVAPQIGDLVCASSGEDAGKVDYDTTTDYRAHCDIVIAIKQGEIDVIGGNVGDSVSKRTLKVDSQGTLIDTSRPWFVVIKNQLEFSGSGGQAMITYNTRVKKAFSSQSTLINKGEHCSADPEKLATIGRAVGHQIRVKHNENEYALYTVSETRQETPDTIIRMAQEARARLTPDGSDIPDEFDAIVDSQVPHPTYTDWCAEAHSEFVERLTDNGTHTGLVVIAPHGGKIEEGTDRQAERVASQLAAKGVSCWRCKGFKQGGGAFERWHITSPDINEASFPLLNTIINRSFTSALAFHGFDQQEILIGGRADEALKCEIKSAIQRAIVGSGIDVNIATAADNFNGDNPNNIVNRLANGNGIQIEQSLAARQNYWQPIADAIAFVYKGRI
jgi:phage replication-related protein YjqB (UPF0714/DUF867 family)